LSAGEQNGGSRHGRRGARPRVRRIGGRRIIAEGLEGNFWKDVYHNAMTVSWPVFVAALAAAFVALNFVFALTYDLGDAPVAKAHSLADLFYFSVETSSTTGYGNMYPQTTYGHVVATAENFVAVLLLATMTGLVFARISRPRARIIFARYAVVATHNGVATLMFRMANARSNFISEATAKAWMIGPSVTKEGRRSIGFQPMRLIKSENPTLALSWVLFHPIDSDSPLFGVTAETLAASEINFIFSIVGFDETSGQIVHARDVLPAQDVRYWHEYEDIVWIDDQGLRHIDYSKIDSTRPASPPVESGDSV
jgi:inward rectifier potassium channel